MSQNTSGWRSFLSLPWIYRLSQNLLGASAFYKEVISDHIRPFPGMCILDLGCGPAPVLRHLPAYIRYVGIDVSPEYISAARKKNKNRGEFYCLAIENLPNAGLSGFDLVLGLGVLHHLDDLQARFFFSNAYRVLNKTGRCLTIDPCLVPGQSPFSRFLINRDRGQNIRSPEQYEALAKPKFSRVMTFVRNDGIRLPYTHNIMDCTN